MLEVDPEGIVTLELERDASRAVDVDAVADEKPVQRVEVETGQVHVFRPHGDIQTVQADQNAFVPAEADLARLAKLSQIRKGLASESPDHGSCVS